MTKIVTHPGARTDRNPTPEAIGAIKLHSILQGVGGWGISEDFVGGTTEGTWTKTDVGTITATAFGAAADVPGGAYLLDLSDATNDEAVQVQLVGDSFKAAAGANIYFGTLLKLELLTGELFAGLSITDASLTAGGNMDSIDYVGFFWDQADLLFEGMKASAAESNDTGLALTADTYVKLEFVITDTNSAIPFVNGIRYPEAKLTAPTVAAVTPSLSVIAGAGSPNVTVDWVKCYQLQDLSRVGSA